MYNLCKASGIQNSAVREKPYNLKYYNIIDTSFNKYTLPWCLHYLLLKIIVTFSKTNTVNQKLAFNLFFKPKTIFIIVLCGFTKKKMMPADNF